jgi:hypothetical protein
MSFRPISPKHASDLFTLPAPITFNDDANSPLGMPRKRSLAWTAAHTWCTPSGQSALIMSALKLRLFLRYRSNQVRLSNSIQDATSRQWTTSSWQMRPRKWRSTPNGSTGLGHCENCSNNPKTRS